MAALPGNAELPSKEASIFKSVVKHYEDKSYKKGIKEADKILKQAKFKNHGETQAMKGLILNNMDGKKEEAYALVRLGLRNNLRSHVCWHVYGLLHRSDRNYDEAIKSYLQALKIDPENLQILRDVGLLQAQMRQYQPYVETRRKLLELKSNQRANWVGFAVAAYVAGNHKQAIHVLDAYRGTDKADPKEPNEMYERSEMELFKNRVLRESGELEKAQEHLVTNEKYIVDKLAWHYELSQLKLKKSDFEGAREGFNTLLEMNPDNGLYHTGLQCATCGLAEPPKHWSAEHAAKVLELYDGMIAKAGPKCVGLQRERLNFLPAGEAFAHGVGEYVKRYVRRGIPSLLQSLKGLYADEAKVTIIGEVFESFLVSLKATSSFPGSEEWESPSVRVWTLVFLAQHHSKLRHVVKAIGLIDEAIAHTPTIVEMYLVKARILKRGGDLQAAQEQADYARRLDLQDRYLNTKGALYMFRADKTDLAEDTMSLFTKDGEQPNNLFDMQCMWYELECGQSYVRQRLFGRALKKFTAIEKHYVDWVDDQFDFHSYCLRKMTVNAYVDLLRFVDNLHARSMYEKAALAMIECYLYVMDNPSSPEAGGEPDEFAHLTAKERKKAISKKRKEAAAKAEEEEAAAKKTGSKKKGKDGDEPKEDKDKDKDPNGEELLKLEPPKMLERTEQLLKQLQLFCGASITTHLAAASVYQHAGRHLLVMQALKRARAIDAGDARLHEVAVAYLSKAADAEVSNATVKEVLLEESAAYLGGRTLGEFNAAYAKAAVSVDQKIAGARMMLLLGEAPKKAAALLAGAKPTAFELEGSVTACSLLAGWAPAKAEVFQATCGLVFPLASFFAPKKAEEEA